MNKSVSITLEHDTQKETAKKHKMYLRVRMMSNLSINRSRISTYFSYINTPNWLIYLDLLCKWRMIMVQISAVFHALFSMLPINYKINFRIF